MIVITGLVPVIPFSTGVKRKPCALRRLVAAVFDNPSNSEGKDAHQVFDARLSLLVLLHLDLDTRAGHVGGKAYVSSSFHFRLARCRHVVDALVH